MTALSVWPGAVEVPKVSVVVDELAAINVTVPVEFVPDSQLADIVPE
jgi:hypothetical protein